MNALIRFSRVEAKPQRWLIALLFIPWCFILPLLPLLSRHIHGFSVQSDYAYSTLRTIVVATSTTLICIALGISFAWHCRSLTNVKLQLSLGLLLIPTLSGGIFWGFIGKIVTLRIAMVANMLTTHPVATTYVFASVLYIFLFGPLASYIFWLRSRLIPVQNNLYARTTGLSNADYFHDIFSPHLESIVYIIATLVFLLTATESATTDLSVHPSVGAGTALLSHWLLTNYNSWLPASPLIATGQTVAYGTLVAALVLFGALALSFSITRALRFTRCKNAVVHNTWTQSTPRLQIYVVLFSICVIGFPYISSYLLYPPHIFPGAFGLFMTALFIIPEAGFCFCVATAVGVALRLWNPWIRSSSGTPWRSLYLLILHPLAIPPIVYVVASFWWFGVIGLTPLLTVGSWILGELTISMPLLLCFSLWTYSSVTDRELDYQITVGVSLVRLLKTSFWDRFKREHLLLFLFAWIIIWNDNVINRAAAPLISSLYSIIAPTLSVRPDYSAAQFCLLISVVIGLIILVVWSSIFRTTGPFRERV